MGQGGYLIIKNKTPYRWSKAAEPHSYQMKSWDRAFPSVIEADSSARVYIEWTEGTKNKKDDAGEFFYRIEELNCVFQFQARAKSGFEIKVVLNGIPGVSRGEISLGWEHDGTLFFTLTGNRQHMDYIASNQPHNRWMEFLPDTARLSQLTIPGTHDTCTFGINEGLIKGLPNEVLAMFGWATLAVPIIVDITKCQNLNLRQQLDQGIRFLDIRLKKDGNKLEAYHSGIRLHMNFSEIVRQCYDFLDTNNRETIIMSVKNEGGESIEELVKAEVAQNIRYWCTEKAGDGALVPRTTIPDLGAARQKLVLLRRFGAKEMNYGLNAAPGVWEDDASFRISMNKEGEQTKVQDEYVVDTLFDIHKKWERVEQYLKLAEGESRDTLFINFASGASGGAYPYSVAYKGDGVTIKGVNTRMMHYFRDQIADRRYGIVPMDFTEKTHNLVTALINFNAFGG